METVNFASLIAPLPVEDFFKNYWEKSFIHLPRKQSGYFDKVLTISDIDHYLRQQNLMPEGIRLINKNGDIQKNRWTKNETLLDGTIKTIVDPNKIFQFFHHESATIILNSVEKMIPCLTDACRAFEQELKIRAQANIYITPPNSQGFHLHYDPHDIFTMQIKGPKTWKIYDSGEELPTTNRPLRKEPVLISEFNINSGDFMYMPRGTVHEAFTSEVSTIHVNFSLKPYYGFHLIEDLAKAAEREDAFFRRIIPTDVNNSIDIKEYSITFKQKLLELIEKTTPEKLLEKRHEQFASNQLLDFGGRLINSLQLENLNLNSSIVRRKGFTYKLIVNKTEVKIKFAEHELKIPHFVEKDIFLQDYSFKVKDIKGMLTNNGKLALAREFLEAGFLTIEEVE